MKALLVREHGDVNGLNVTEIPAPAHSAREVVVRIEASGVNRSDVLSVQGSFAESPLPRIPGRDFAGKIVEGPANMIGEQVWGSGGDLGVTRDGTHAEFVVIPLDAVSRRPRNLSAEQAAAAGLPFITAYSALITLAHVEAGEWVIISGAAGGVGLAAIQLAHANRARVIALVKDESEAWVRDRVDALARSDEGNLQAIVRESTGGKGAEIALNGVGAAIFEDIDASLANYARHVVYSGAGGREVNLDLMNLYRRQMTLAGLNTQLLDAAACARILDQLKPLFEAGALQAPTVEMTFALSNAVVAYRHVASGGVGKAVLTM